jgi:hypothetical protein
MKKVLKIRKNAKKSYIFRFIQVRIELCGQKAVFSDVQKKNEFRIQTRSLLAYTRTRMYNTRERYCCCTMQNIICQTTDEN